LEGSQDELLEEPSEETVEPSVEQVVAYTDCFVDEPVVQVLDDSPLAHSSRPMVAESDDELRGPEDCALQGQLKDAEVEKGVGVV